MKKIVILLLVFLNPVLGIRIMNWSLFDITVVALLDLRHTCDAVSPSLHREFV